MCTRAVRCTRVAQKAAAISYCPAAACHTALSVLSLRTASVSPLCVSSACLCVSVDGFVYVCIGGGVCLINSIAGELSPLQLRKILVRFGIDMPPDLWDEVLGKLDKDRDGMVQIGEFMQGMKHAVADVKVTTQPAN